jgi:hypothetical protein
VLVEVVAGKDGPNIDRVTLPVRPSRGQNYLSSHILTSHPMAHLAPAAGYPHCQRAYEWSQSFRQRQISVCVGFANAGPRRAAKKSTGLVTEKTLIRKAALHLLAFRPTRPRLRPVASTASWPLVPMPPIAAKSGTLGQVLSSLKERGRVNGGFDGVLAVGGRA